MTDYTTLFLQRIGMAADTPVTFDTLPDILAHTAYSIPFENISLMEHNLHPLTKKEVRHKLLLENKGGLCYEINPSLYYFLAENKMDVKLLRGTIYNQQTNDWSDTGQTHVLIGLNIHGKEYVLDAGFGINLPLLPVPMNGQPVNSSTGTFRVIKAEGALHQLLMKPINRADWVIGYSFDPSIVISEKELNAIQDIIATHPLSPFNKKKLVAQLVPNGSIKLTEKNFTQTLNGIRKQEVINKSRFAELAREVFHLPY